MSRAWLNLMAVPLYACGDQAATDSPAPAQGWCEEFYARFNISDLVDPRTGRVERDPTTNEIVDPNTGRIQLTRREEECVRRESQKAVDRYEGE